MKRKGKGTGTLKKDQRKKAVGKKKLPKKKAGPKGTTPVKKSKDLKGFTLWFTGLSGSGKSTVADRVASLLDKEGYKVQRLDGDIVRQSLTRDLGFSKKDRDLNIERITFVAEVLTKNGIATLVSFISPYRKARDHARERIENVGRFIEVFVDCTLDECINRDVKGMYKKAIAGQIKEFTGISDPYEEPLDPEIILRTHEETLRQSANKVMTYLRRTGYI